MVAFPPTLATCSSVSFWRSGQLPARGTRKAPGPFTLRVGTAPLFPVPLSSLSEHEFPCLKQLVNWFNFNLCTVEKKTGKRLRDSRATFLLFAPYPPRQ